MPQHSTQALIKSWSCVLATTSTSRRQPQPRQPHEHLTDPNHSCTRIAGQSGSTTAAASQPPRPPTPIPTAMPPPASAPRPIPIASQPAQLWWPTRRCPTARPTTPPPPSPTLSSHWSRRQLQRWHDQQQAWLEHQHRHVNVSLQFHPATDKVSIKLHPAPAKLQNGTTDSSNLLNGTTDTNDLNNGTTDHTQPATPLQSVNSAFKNSSNGPNDLYSQ